MERLSWWALRKGLQVLGTGDFTHPARPAAPRETLVPAEPAPSRVGPELEKRLLRDFRRSAPSGSCFPSRGTTVVYRIPAGQATPGSQAGSCLAAV